MHVTETIDKAVDTMKYAALTVVVVSGIINLCIVTYVVALVMPQNFWFVSYLFGFIYDVIYYEVTIALMDIIVFAVLLWSVIWTFRHIRKFLIQLCKWKIEFELLKYEQKKLIERSDDLMKHIEEQSILNDQIKRIVLLDDKLHTILSNVRIKKRRKKAGEQDVIKVSKKLKILFEQTPVIDDD